MTHTSQPLTPSRRPKRSPAERAWLSLSRRAAVLAALAALLVVVSAVRLGVSGGANAGIDWPAGSLSASLWQLLVRSPLGQTPDYVTLMDIRLLRVVLACAVGAALASSGVALQSLLRNPLAEPFILGLSSGAAVGVMVQLMLSYQLGQPLGGTHLGALAGAAGSMAVVFLASRRQGVIDPLGLLLVGVVLATINGALVMMLNYLAGPAGLREDLMRWMMGYLNESAGPVEVVVIVGLTLAGVAILAALGRAMDVGTFSDAEAHSLGVNLARLRVVLFVVASVLAAGAVVLAGPIGFVGLICPHLVRLLTGPGHRALVVGSALAGASLIVLADMASVLVDLGQGRMPIGIFTAMLGGPVFLWMLRGHLGRG